MRTAELKDIKIGTELINEYGTWVVTEKNADDVWIIKGRRGSKCLFDHQVQYYNINE